MKSACVVTAISELLLLFVVLVPCGLVLARVACVSHCLSLQYPAGTFGSVKSCPSLASPPSMNEHHLLCSCAFTLDTGDATLHSPKFVGLLEKQKPSMLPFTLYVATYLMQIHSVASSCLADPLCMHMVAILCFYREVQPSRSETVHDMAGRQGNHVATECHDTSTTNPTMPTGSL